MYSITDDQLRLMLNWGRFPFIGIPQEDRDKIVHVSTRAVEPRAVFEEVCRKFSEQLETRSKSWQKLIVSSVMLSSSILR